MRPAAAKRRLGPPVALLGLCLALCGASMFGQKPYGVILLGEGGGPEWDKTAAEAIKLLEPSRPAIFAAGDADGRAIQHAVDVLEARRVQKIVAVPLFVTTFSDIMDQNRYLFGIRETPMPGQSSKRLKGKTPLVLAKALDDHPLIVELIAARAASLSRKPDQETLVLVGQAPDDAEAASQWVAAVSSLAEKAARKAGMRSGQAMALRDGLRADARERAEKEVRDALRALRKKSSIVVVPLELSEGLVHRRMPRLLDGIMARYDGKPMLPDARVSRWAVQIAEAAAQLPDMRAYKNDTLAKPKGLSQPSRLNTRPTFNQKRGERP